MKIGLLTSGGDCQGLNGAMRGLIKTLDNNTKEKLEIYGIEKGYKGFINGDYKKLKPEDFEEILNVGGTILGSSREPFKNINEPDEQGRDKIKSMIENYKKWNLDCLVVSGGNGSHKTANLLFENGLNVVTLPKTIDNDLEGTDVSFGFQSAIDVATNYLEDIKTTAKSHGRVFIVELMGHKTGWLTMYAGIAGSADIILIPEIPYDSKKVSKSIEDMIKEKDYLIIAVAEGIISKEEVDLSKKELKSKRKKDGNLNAANRLLQDLEINTSKEIRTCAIGHIQRGGNPCAYDKVITTLLGQKGAELIINKKFGYMASIRNNKITATPLSEVAGKTKMVNVDEPMIKQIKSLGICLGD